MKGIHPSVGNIGVALQVGRSDRRGWHLAEVLCEVANLGQARRALRLVKQLVERVIRILGAALEFLSFLLPGVSASEPGRSWRIREELVWVVVMGGGLGAILDTVSEVSEKVAI